MPDLPVDQLLTVEAAIAILDALPVQPRLINVTLEQAMGLVLAEDIFSDSDYPPFDKALMDGFAVRASDAILPGAKLAVIEMIAAGQMGQREVGPGEAAAIMTGAPLPTGADAVIPIEQTERDGDQVILTSPAKLNQAIARKGSDTASEQLLLSKGTLMGPAQIGVAASVGRAMLKVFAQPVVALLATGDELIAIDQKPSGAQIRNSNTYLMRALLQKLGCTVRELGIARDQPEEIRAAIVTGLDSDALFITGGMSMGEHDYVPKLLRELGLTLQISKLRIKPGKPFVCATGPVFKGVNDGSTSHLPLVFGLPGNPVSAFVCTLRLASRVLNRMAGKAVCSQLEIKKTLTPLSANGPRETYLLATDSPQGVALIKSNGSADLFSLGRANALIVREENAPASDADQQVRVLNIP